MVEAEVEFTLLRRGNRIPYRTVTIEASDSDEFDKILASNKNEIESKFGVETSHKIKNYNNTTEEIKPQVEQKIEDNTEEFFEDSYERSTDFKYAKDAIEFINNNTVDESFIKGEDRVTVKRAFNNK